MPIPASKLSDEQKADVAERYEAGESYVELGKAFGVAPTTIRKYVISAGAEKPKDKKPSNNTSIKRFAARARKLLWKQRKGKEDKKSQYEKWNEEVDRLEGKGVNRNSAIVLTSKEFGCLHVLFREYDVRGFDPNPGSHPDIQHYGQQRECETVDCEGIEQTHRENLTWAIEAAGMYLRTNEEPMIAPNDAAYFLYKQARDDPKEFLGKYTQVDLRGGDDQEEENLAKKAGERSIEEINEMLKTLNEEES